MLEWLNALLNALVPGQADIPAAKLVARAKKLIQILVQLFDDGELDRQQPRRKQGVVGDLHGNESP